MQTQYSTSILALWHNSRFSEEYDYLLHFFFVALLSLITIFRREMSCNSVYIYAPEDVIEKHNRKTSDAKIPILTESYVVEERHSSRNESTCHESIKCDTSIQHLLNELPSEILVQCMTYLHPKDILKLSCCDKLMYHMVHKEESSQSMSSMIWFSLFQRDYSRVLTDYQYGKDAVQRSLRDGNIRCPEMILYQVLMMNNKEQFSDYPIHSCDNMKMKDFYFRFGQTWQIYVIAGRTQNPTLVGIHGHIFNMTPFLEDHPGSPETIIMQGGGKDATRLFESVGHSTLARKIGMHNLLQVVDTSCCSNKGNSLFGCKVLVSGHSASNITGILPSIRSKPLLPGTILMVRKQIIDEKAKAEVLLQRLMSKKVAIDKWSHLNVFFDPLCNSWKGWYLNSEFEPEYII